MTVDQPDAASAAPRHFRIRGSFSYFAPMFASGVILPFFPVWLRSAGLVESEIAVVLAVSMLVKILVSPFVAALSDRLADRAQVLVWSAALSLGLAVLLAFSHGFWPIFLSFCLFNAAFAPYLPVVESIVIAGVRRFGYSYGGMRVWGSLAFVVATLIVGRASAAFGSDAVIVVLVAGVALACVSAFATPRLGAVATRPRGDRSGSPLRLGLQLMLIGACIVQASHGMFYGFSSIYWESIGFSAATIGSLWSAAVLCEIVVFIFAGRLVARFGPWTLMRIGCAVAVCRWMLFPLPLGPFGYFLLQAMHAFSYALLHIGVQQRIIESVSERHEGAAQGNYFFYTNGLLALTTLASGPLFQAYGVEAFHAMAALAVFGLAILMVSASYANEAALSGGKRREALPRDT